MSEPATFREEFEKAFQSYADYLPGEPGYPRELSIALEGAKWALEKAADKADSRRDAANAIRELANQLSDPHV